MRARTSQLQYTPFLAPVTGAIARPTNSKFGDTISAKDFGAVGDGVADDTLKLQAALDASVGKSLYLPPGTYRTTAVLRIKEKTCFFAQKGTATIDVQPTGGTTSLTHGILIDGNEVVIDGLKISGTNQTTVVGGLNTAYAKGILADASISLATYTRPTITNCLIFKWGYGIELRKASTYTITNNRLWGGAQLTDSNPGSASTIDISIYGSSGANASFRGIITGNFCLGNNDTGISAGINEGDRDVTISNNVVEPLQEDGITPIADVNNKTRYGIIVGYSGVSSCRTTISSNVVRNYAITGINSQTKTRPGGDIIIANNVISGCGRDQFYVTDRGFKAGIFVDGGADSITGNIILDCCRAGIVSSSVLAVVAGTQHNRPVISGNNIARITVDTITSPSAPGGHGIFVSGSNISGVLVSSNMVQDIAGIGIKVDVLTGADNGNVHLVANQIITTSLEGGIQISNGGSLECAVIGNKITGASNAVDTPGLNVGVLVTSVAGSTVHCLNNIITKFAQGIKYPTFSTRNVTTQASGNVVKDCRDGIGSSGAGPWIITNNVFNGTIAREVYGGAWQGIMYQGNDGSGFDGGPVIHVVDTRAAPQPVSGTWAVGDTLYYTNPIAGGFIGAVCVTAGTQGNWKTFGAITA